MSPEFDKEQLPLAESPNIAMGGQAGYASARARCMNYVYEDAEIGTMWDVNEAEL